ncbi:MAG: hypothetical protein DHS20C03_27090 [Minwuia thermotolerans]|nr:MAG: hypothetical protein DHS20C03_27090 [Minwuia thermotolerans]
MTEIDRLQGITGSIFDEDQCRIDSKGHKLVTHDMSFWRAIAAGSAGGHENNIPVNTTNGEGTIDASAKCATRRSVRPYRCAEDDQNTFHLTRFNLVPDAHIIPHLPYSGTGPADWCHPDCP